MSSQIGYSYGETSCGRTRSSARWGPCPRRGILPGNPECLCRVFKRKRELLSDSVTKSVADTSVAAVPGESDHFSSYCLSGTRSPAVTSPQCLGRNSGPVPASVPGEAAKRSGKRTARSVLRPWSAFAVSPVTLHVKRVCAKCGNKQNTVPSNLKGLSGCPYMVLILSFYSFLGSL